MIKLSVLALAVAICSANMSAFDLKGTLGNAGADGKSLGQLGNALGGVINDLTATDSVTPDMLVGDWSYTSPAVNFDGGNVIQNVGGSAVSSTIESKLAPYYEQAGVTSLKLSVDNQANFSMSLKVGTLTGVIEQAEDGNLVFNFKAFKSINIGRIATKARLSGNKLDLTFDVSGLIKILKTVSQIANQSSFSAIVKMLESYDGLYAGFTLTKN